jgi:hypothetical protein
LALTFHGSGDQLIFQQPVKAGVGVDFHVHLRVPSVSATGPIRVELSAPESFGIRTDYKCPASGILAPAGAACGTVASDVFEVDWTITPKSTCLPNCVPPLYMGPTGPLFLRRSQHVHG